MISIIVSFLLSFDATHTVLHEYAIQTVNQFAESIGNPAGPYDVCFELAGGVWDSKKGFIKDPDPNQLAKYGYPVAIQDACALVLFGAEY
jgi:hypothetical protein